MGLVIVALLVVLWAWILVPGAVRERRESSPLATVSRFERSMARLARTHRGGVVRAKDASGRDVWVLDRPEAVLHGDAPRRAARRRRTVLTCLTAATTLALVGAQVVGGVFVALLWLSGVLLAVFLLLLVHRWVRVSREAATPLLRSPAAEAAAIAARAERWRAARREARGEAAEPRIEPDPVRVVEW